MVEGQGARRLRVACRDFFRKVVLSARGVARPSLCVSVIWGEGRNLSGLRLLILSLTPLPLGSVQEGERNLGHKDDGRRQ